MWLSVLDYIGQSLALALWIWVWIRRSAVLRLCQGLKRWLPFKIRQASDKLRMGFDYVRSVILPWGRSPDNRRGRVISSKLG